MCNDPLCMILERFSFIILAAGKGARLKSDLPKVFHEIGGLPLLAHITTEISSAMNLNSMNANINANEDTNANDLVIVANPEYKDKCKSILQDTYLPRSCAVALQETPRGTADAVKCGLDRLEHESEWVYILYGDIPLVEWTDLQEMLRIAKEGGDKTAAAVVLAFASDDNAADLGRLEQAEEEGTIKGIIEAKDVSKFNGKKLLPLCNAGLLVNRELLAQFIKKIEPNSITGEFYITDIIRLLHEAGHVCRYHKGKMQNLMGINTRSDLALLEKTFQEKQRKKHMNNGVTLVAPETVFFSYDTHIEKDVIIHPYVVFRKGVCISSGSEVGPFCVVEGTSIENATVGPFARTREKTHVSNGAKIGNFVEVKNSEIGKKVKVNHLSYIGDTAIDNDTNIGAGTITCNYDGVEKHKTKIGKNVFVGSNTSLIAPLQIHDNAVIGAGSVIVKDVEKGDLAIARNVQKNIENWHARNVRKKSLEDCKKD